MDRKVALQVRNFEPWRDVVREMEKAGFRYISIGFGDKTPLLQNNWREYVADISETLQKHNIRCVQTHAPYYDLLISAESYDPDMETALLRAVEATKLLGAEICAVHPRSYITAGMPRETAVNREKSLQENLKAFASLAKMAEECGVLLGIENLMKFPFEHPFFYSWIAEDHCELIDRLNSPAVAAVWDFGHANLVDTDHAARIRTLGSRIKATHVHNNAGVDDNHFPPFIPGETAYFARRVIDWPQVLTALQDTGYEGYLTLENDYNFKCALGPFIRYLYDSICELDQMMRG